VTLTPEQAQSLKAGDIVYVATYYAPFLWDADNHRLAKDHDPELARKAWRVDQVLIKLAGPKTVSTPRHGRVDRSRAESLYSLTPEEAVADELAHNAQRIEKLQLEVEAAQRNLERQRKATQLAQEFAPTTFDF
jgi:hypothetical protein